MNNTTLTKKLISLVVYESPSAPVQRLAVALTSAGTMIHGGIKFYDESLEALKKAIPASSVYELRTEVKSVRELKKIKDHFEAFQKAQFIE